MTEGMVEVRFHGRGGQGAWTASQLLAYGGLRERKFVQSFPTFGQEREGAPIQAFTRISSTPITIHSMVYEPDIVVVLDPTLVGPQVTEGIDNRTILVINTDASPFKMKGGLGLTENDVWVVNATEQAMKILGRPITNTAVLGALLKARRIIELDSLLQAIKERFSGRLAEMNMKLVQEAYMEARNK